jgi:periplasmic protein TonB
VKFTPPVIKKDEEVKEEEKPPKQEEIKKAAVSTETVKGDENADLSAPTVVVEDKGKGLVEAPPPPPKEEKKEIFREVAYPAEFPGGMDKLSSFLGDNLEFPEVERERNAEGRVVVEFIIDETGSLSNFKVTESAGKNFDNEAIRVLKKMPKWKPGRQNTGPVSMYFTLPVTFTLQEGE